MTRPACSHQNIFPPFEGSRKVYRKGVIHPGLRVPFREVELDKGKANIRLYDVTGPWSDGLKKIDLKNDLPPVRGCGRSRPGVTQRSLARRGEVSPEMEFVAIREGVKPEFVCKEVAAGRAIIPANVKHPECEPMAIGRNFLVKINANIGNSALSSGIEQELEKMLWSIRWGADTVMDLSTGKNIRETRERIIRHSPGPQHLRAAVPDRQSRGIMQPSTRCAECGRVSDERGPGFSSASAPCAFRCPAARRSNRAARAKP